MQAKAAMLIHGDEVEWVPSPFPGISYKFLKIDDDGMKVVDLIKIDKGVQLPAHRHTVVQQAFLLSGRAQLLDGTIAETGTYIEIPAGVRHGSTALEEVIWLDIWPGMVTWHLDDGEVLNVKLDGSFVSLGKGNPLGTANLI